MFPPRLRNLALTAHVVTSVGWLGAVLVFLVLAISGLIGDDDALVRGAYLSMQVVAWRVIVPLCFASLATGVVQSMGTKWGLVQHYWVLIKLVMTVLATVFLLLHMRPIDELAQLAATDLANRAHHGLRVQLVIDSAAALIVLIVTTVLAVYKPRGMTRYGRRKQREASSPA